MGLCKEEKNLLLGPRSYHDRASWGLGTHNCQSSSPKLFCSRMYIVYAVPYQCHIQTHDHVTHQPVFL